MQSPLNINETIRQYNMDGATTEEKMFYHISPTAYAQGDVVSVESFNGTTFYHQGLDSQKKAIDNYLSENRPGVEPSRDHCIYAFDKPEYCVFFRNKELRAGETFHLYKCKVDNNNGHPMILVGMMKTPSEQIKEKLANEYWNPTRSWKLLEYMSEKIEILEEIPITAELITHSIMIGKCYYSEDYDRANYFLKH